MKSNIRRAFGGRVKSYFHEGNQELDHPPLPKHPGKLNDSRCNSFQYRGQNPSSPSQGHGPTPPEGGTYYHWRRDSAPPPHYCTHDQEREPVYLYGDFSYPHICGALRWEFLRK
ncbi:hypothetical protein AVEN_48856-1 [Araneus ventricosus]|uniref:Uncharacterized protein n=1 Tax=Araneus ventricosus TaxID=182803 RepID=A0A4Y2AG94_ARAVE|nr:hypothetical protein AVEN_48856-1 [Araneus ventricosus]